MAVTFICLEVTFSIYYMAKMIYTNHFGKNNLSFWQWGPLVFQPRKIIPDCDLPIIDFNSRLVGNSRKNPKVTRSVQNKIDLTLYYIMVILLKKIGVKMAVW